QEDINLKFLRSLPTEWRTHTLIWRNKTDLEDQSLDDLFNNLNIYEAEVKSSSSTSPTTQNIVFVSSQSTDSTRESVSDVNSVSAASTKVPVSAFLNVDGHADYESKEADEEPTNYALMAFTSSSSSSFDNEVAPCLGYDNQVFNSTVFDCDELISFELDVSMPTSPVHDRNFYTPKPDLVFYDAPTANETVPTVLNVETSTTKPNKDLSQPNRPSAPIIEDWVSDSEDESEGEPMPTQKSPSFV
nr:ribonuclease H-like domain-containing protein [Tanacetum cinerariifolium]